MSSELIKIIRIFTISRLKSIGPNIKIRNKFIEFLTGLFYFSQIIGGSEIWKYAGIDCVNDLSWNMLSKSIKSIPLLMKGNLIYFYMYFKCIFIFICIYMICYLIISRKMP